MELFEAIYGRRSCRRLSGQPVTREDLNAVLDAGRFAPSWANTQCQEVVVVRDPEIKQRLHDTLTPRNPARGALLDAPVVLVLCGRKGCAGFKGGEPSTVLGDWLMFDLGLFAQNITLAAHALGLGTVHVGAFDHGAVAEVLAAPEDVQPVEIIPLGHPAAEPGTAPRRRELEDFVHEERFAK